MFNLYYASNSKLSYFTEYLHIVYRGDYNMKINVYRKTPTKEVLQHIYDVMNKNIKNPKCFYTSDQVKQLKKYKSNVWL